MTHASCLTHHQVRAPQSLGKSLSFLQHCTELLQERGDVDVAQHISSNQEKQPQRSGAVHTAAAAREYELKFHSFLHACDVSLPPMKTTAVVTMLLPCTHSAAFTIRQAGTVRVAMPLLGSRRAIASATATTVAMPSSRQRSDGQVQVRRRARETSAELPLFYNDVYRVELPEGHRFPMEKYRLVREGLQGKLGGEEEEEEGKTAGARATSSFSARFSVSPVATLVDLCTTHQRSYVKRYLEGRFTDRENRTVGFPWSEASVRRSLSSVGGTVGAMHAVCAGGGELRDRLAGGGKVPPLFSGHIAGGTHHAFWDRGEGFCVFSDIAVAANVALRDYPETVRQILIVDCDVHQQGNGNAVLFKSKPAVFTFSIHCKANYFSEKEKSDVDIEVEEGTGDEEYLALLSARLSRLVDEVRPDLIFYQGGVDPLQHDRLGRLNLTREGLRIRNRLVYETARARGIPTVITMGGGYPRDLDPTSESFGHIVRSHQDVYEDAAECIKTSALSGGG
ncbi:unnamed protein product [Pylaiella littoralis]